MNYVDKQLSSRLHLQDFRDWVIGYDKIFNTWKKIYRPHYSCVISIESACTSISSLVINSPALDQSTILDSLYFTDWGKILAYVSLTLVPAVVFFFALQKYIVAGLTGGAVKE